MNNNILLQRGKPGALSSREHKRTHLLKGVEFSILVDRYDAVTPFGEEGQ